MKKRQIFDGQKIKKKTCDHLIFFIYSSHLKFSLIVNKEKMQHVVDIDH